MDLQTTDRLHLSRPTSLLLSRATHLLDLNTSTDLLPEPLGGLYEHHMLAGPLGEYWV